MGTSLWPFGWLFVVIGTKATEGSGGHIQREEESLTEGLRRMPSATLRLLGV